MSTSYIKQRKQKMWEEWEKELIKQLYSICSYAEIASYLGRTWQQVHYMALKLNLKSGRKIRSSCKIDKSKLDEAVKEFITLVKTHVFTPKYSNSQTICWDCYRAGGGRGCEWIDQNFKPVKGWKATPTCIRNKHKGKIRYESSYIVHECPKFKPNPINVSILDLLT